MANSDLGVVLQRLRTLLRPEGGDGEIDERLLRRFTVRRDQAAFAELVRRHRPMVLGVCWRLSADAHAAEDAFQATFLVLARRAAAPSGAGLGGWLHGVARRIALKARRSRQPTRPVPAARAGRGRPGGGGRGPRAAPGARPGVGGFARQVPGAARAVRPGGPHPRGGRPRAGLAPGKYALSFRYESLDGRKTPGPALSTGKATTAEVTFEILDNRNASKAVRVEGLEFEALIPARVLPPAAGGAGAFDLGLRVTNVSDKPLALRTFDVIRPVLYAVSGQRVIPLKFDGGRDGKPKPTPPATLAPGASWTWQPQATLRREHDGATLTLSGPDGLGVNGFWAFIGLHTAAEGLHYCLSVDYANGDPTQDAAALWVGKATTNEAEFEIADLSSTIESARQAAETALRDDYEARRKKYADQGKSLPEHKGGWIPAEPASYHMREITDQPDVVRIKWWTAKEGGFGYEAEAEVDRKTLKVRITQASAS